MALRVGITADGGTSSKEGRASCCSGKARLDGAGAASRASPSETAITKTDGQQTGSRTGIFRVAQGGPLIIAKFTYSASTRVRKSVHHHRLRPRLPPATA